MNDMNFPAPKANSLGTDAPAERVGGRSALRQYLNIVRRRKWVILGAIAASLVVGLVATLLMTPKYMASTTLEIQRESQNIIRVEGAQQEANQADLEFYQTQYGLLQSRSLAARVATELRLYDDAHFFQMMGASSDTAGWFENGRPTRAATRDERIRKAAEILLNHLGISPERLSRLVAVSFTSPDADFSKRVVDAWAVHFIQATLERRVEATSYARRYLEGRLAQLRGRLDESERMLVGYASRERIINLPATTPATGEGGVSGERSIVAEDLVAINRELSRAVADRVTSQSRLRAGGSVTESLENQAIGLMRGRRAELSAEYARLTTQFEADYPPARALANQIAQIDRAISTEEGRVRRTLEQTYQSNVARETDLRNQVRSLEAGILDLRRRSIQYNIFQRDVDTNRELYNGLLQRYKEIGVAGGVGVNNISIVDHAEAPEKPTSPKPLLNMALALLFGLVLGAGAALALEQIDEAIADPTEIETSLGLPFLGTIPKVSEDLASALDDRKSPIAEAYMSVQTSLSFSTDHGVPKSIAVTSARPGEGKSTTSYALARALARRKKRTLLVDADMRSPSVHVMTALKNETGLSNFLAGSDDVKSLLHLTNHDGMYVMTAGPQPPSAAELLSGDRLERLIATLSESFDHIVFDAPPVMGLADAPLIASKVEGMVFLIESRGTKRTIAQVAIERLRAANAQMLGVVLAKFESKHAHYGYGYEYGYGYGASATDGE
ncbi:GumC family protein [Allosphingosinicella sp.]|uniref:GumC family protein n=1 Tax=Allosphingosinicella sp. TaxID=2823234 RepID=UPI003784CB4D